jgi:hypothetical protein
VSRTPKRKKPSEQSDAPHQSDVPPPQHDAASVDGTDGLGVTWTRTGKSGTGTLVITLPDGPFTDKVNIVSDRDRAAVIDKLRGRLRPDAVDVLREKLEQLAAQQAGNTSRGGNETSDKDANRLIHLVTATPGVELFHAPGDTDTGYATVRVDDRLETYRLSSSAFRVWMTRRFFKEFGGAPSSQAVSDAIHILTAQAIFDGPTIEVKTRTAFHRGAIVIDLGDTKRRVVRVTQHGWRVISNVNAPVRFVRRQGLLPLPMPSKRGDINLLRRFVNVRDEQSWILLVGWLVHALYPKGPFAILVISGEQGSAKSTTARMLQKLIDPNKGSLRRPPKSEQDLMIGASNTWLFALDNLSGLRNDLSDTLCTVATGGGYAARSLFTNDEESIIDVQRPVLLNGIDELSRRADLLDRAVLLQLPAIPENQRRAESDLWQEYDAALPQIFGAILDALVAVLQHREEIHLPTSPRMADFAKTVCAAEVAFGWEAGTFLRAYEGNRRVANTISLEESEVGQRIVRLMTNTSYWQGTAAQLREQLIGIGADAGSAAGGKVWRPRVESLAKELRRVAPVLRKCGIDVDMSLRSTDRDRSRLVTISAEGRLGSTSDEACGADSSDGLSNVNCPAKSAPQGHPRWRGRQGRLTVPGNETVRSGPRTVRRHPGRRHAGTAAPRSGEGMPALRGPPRRTGYV